MLKLGWEIYYEWCDVEGGGDKSVSNCVKWKNIEITQLSTTRHNKTVTYVNNNKLMNNYNNLY